MGVVERLIEVQVARMAVQSVFMRQAKKQTQDYLVLVQVQGYNIGMELIGDSLHTSEVVSGRYELCFVHGTPNDSSRRAMA